MAKKTTRQHVSKIPYKVTRKTLDSATGQRRAVYEAVKKGATTADAVRHGVRDGVAFRGVSDTTLKNNVAFHLKTLRRDGFLTKGGKQ